MHVSSSATTARALIRAHVAQFAAAAFILGAGADRVVAQAASPAHPRICADGVRRYDGKAAIKTSFDTLAMPPGQPIRVTNPDEERAADRQILERAGSVGATGVVLIDRTVDDGSGMMRMSRSVTAVFVPADTARAHAACRAGGM
jgi:hypothetical protein